MMKRFGTRQRIGVGVLIVGVILGVVAIPRLLRVFFPPQYCPDQPELITSGPGHWAAAASIPTLRGETRVGELDGMIYLIGGLMVEWKASELIDRYDPVTDTWQKRSPLPSRTNHPGVASLDGKLYVSGGFNSPDFTFNLKSLWRYDPALDQWEALADMPEVRAAHLMKALNGKLYVLGGDGASDPTSVWIYDPATNTWDADSAAHMTSERDHLAGAVLDGKLYVMGGRWRHKGKFSITEIYDPLANTWTVLADMPVPRSGLTADVINDKIHVVGGEDIDIFCTYSEHDVYDPATNTWERWPNLPTPRHGLASAVVGDRWYVVGGATSSGPFTQRTFTDSVDIWIPNSEKAAT